MRSLDIRQNGIESYLASDNPDTKPHAWLCLEVAGASEWNVVLETGIKNLRGHFKWRHMVKKV